MPDPTPTAPTLAPTDPTQPVPLEPLAASSHEVHADDEDVPAAARLAADGLESLSFTVHDTPEPVRDAASEPAAGEMLGPVRVRTPDGGELAFFGMFASFDTPFEVTTSELAVELLFPADRATAERLRGRAGRA